MNKSKLTNQEKKDAARYRVIATGKKIKAVKIGYGEFEDIKTGQRYMNCEVKYLGYRRQIRQFGFHIWRFGLFLYGREYMKYNSWFIVPGVTVDVVNGIDFYVDFELKALFVGVGIRFVWIKRKIKQ